MALSTATEPASAQDPGRPSLLRAPHGGARDHPHKGPLPRRSRLATLRLDALTAAEGRDAPPVVDLNLFDDATLTARVERYEPRGAGSFLWKGRLDGFPNGHATFVSTDGIVAGTVFAEGATYEVGYAGDGVYEVRELDPSAFPSDDPASHLELIPPADAAAEEATGPSPGVTDSSTHIDVLVVWTPRAETAAGGASAIRSLVDLAVANANTAYANSGVSTRLRLVYKTQVSYAESSTISTDLSRLVATSDGHMDAVHSLRNQYGADIVSLLGAGYTTSSGACGIGYLMTSVATSFASWAFNVVDYSCAAGNLSFAHEVGHNEGMHHDPPNAGSAGAYSYSYGYIDPSCVFRTVMAYGGCTRVTQFSSPSVSYGGRVTGTSTQNNALTLNNTASTVANFRQAVSTSCAYGLSASSWTAPSSGGSSTLAVTVTGSGCSWTATSSASWLSITSGASGTASGTVAFTVAANASATVRSATITVAGQTFTVTQPGTACSYSVTPSALNPGAAGGVYSVVVSTGAGCGWTASGGGSWARITSGASGSGNGTVGLTISPNLSTSASRGTVITIAGKPVTVSQPVAPAVQLRSFTASRTYPIPTGSATTWTAAATGGATALEYKFWRYSSTAAAWTVVRDYAPGNTWSWTPESTAAGPYALQVWVRQSGSAANYEAWAGTGTFRVVAPAGATPVTVSSFRPNVAFPKPVGTTVTWTALAGGGSGPLEYQFWVYNGSTWTIGRPYSAGNQFAWTPTVAGSYALQVWVRQAGSTATYQAWLGSGLVTIAAPSNDPVTTVKLSADRTLPVTAGSLVKWTGAANGSNPEYEFWLYDGNGWVVLQPYGSAPTCSWMPVSPGRYALQVWARRADSSAAYEAWAGSGTFSVLP